MLRTRRQRSPLGALWLIGLVGCGSTETAPQQVAPASAEAKVEVEAAESGPAEAAEPAAQKPPPLSEEDLALIAADPKDLTPEMRRKRAYARRRQIMQNPDSPTARALQDLAEAHRSGELNIEKRDGVWLSLPGTTPESGRPPAGWRPSDGEAAPGEGEEAKAEPAPAPEPAP